VNACKQVPNTARMVQGPVWYTVVYSMRQVRSVMSVRVHVQGKGLYDCRVRDTGFTSRLDGQMPYTVFGTVCERFAAS
jgi:hypothetical protein